MVPSTCAKQPAAKTEAAGYTAKQPAAAKMSARQPSVTTEAPGTSAQPPYEAKAGILYEDAVHQVYGFDDFRGVEFDYFEETAVFVARCEGRCP